MTKACLMSAASLICLAAPLSAAAQTPDVLSKLYACKQIADSEQRLACYDSNVGYVEAAQETGDLVAIDKAGVKKMQRESFGFNIPSLPKLSAFKSKNAEGAQTESVPETLSFTIASVKKMNSGRYMFTLENGQVWSQTETVRVASSARRSGSTLAVKKSSLGGFMGRINGSGKGFKIKRVE